MVRRGPRWTTCAAVLVLASGCVPGRDNPYDPQNAPDASVRVVDLTTQLTPEVRECAAVTDTGTFVQVAAASRGSCLALELSGTELDEWRFLVTSTGGGESLDLALEPRNVSRIEIPEAYLRRWPTNIAITFELRGRDAGGDQVRTETTLVLLNTPPVAVSDPLRVLPAGGFAWTPGQAFQVEFTGGQSFDADRDPLELCFRFPGEMSDECRSHDDPPFVRTISTSAGTFVAEMWARDPSEESSRTRSVVRVGVPPAWIGADLGGGRLDPERRSVAVPAPNRGLVPIPSVPERIAELGSTLRLIDPADRSVVSSLAVHPDGYDAGVWSPARQVFWGVASGALAADAAAEAWRIDADQPVADRPRRVLAPSLTQTLLGLSLDTDADGDLWIAAVGETAIHHTAWASTAVSMVAVPQPVAAVAVRPDADGNATKEVWVLASAEEGAFVYRVEGDFTLSEIAFIEDGFDSGALAWVDHEELWMVHPVRGALRLDAERLLATGLLEAAIVTEAPIGFSTVGRTDMWRVERDTRSLVLVTSLASSQAGRTFRISLDGVVESSSGDELARLRALGRDGLLYYSTVGGGGGPPIPRSRVGRTTSTNVDLIATTPLYIGSSRRDAHGVDETTGGYWTLSRRPSIVRVFPDGRFEELAGAQDETQAEITPPTLFTLSVSRDGTTAWALAGEPPSFFPATDVYRIDLTTRPPTYERMDFDPITPISSGVYSLQAYGVTGATALYREVAGTVERIAQDGTRSTFRALGAGESSAVFTDAGPTGGACIAVPYDDTGTPSTRVEWISPGGDATELGIHPLGGMGTGAGIRGVESALDADGSPVCWLLIGESNGFGYGDLTAWDESGLLHSRSDAELQIGGAAGGPYARSAHDVWIVDGPIGEVGNQSADVIHLFFDPAGPYLESEELESTGLRHLVR